MARGKLDAQQIGWSEAIAESIKIGTTTLGDELVTNGTFDSDASGWTLDDDWAYDSGKLTKSAGSGTYANITQTISGVESGTLYIIQFTTSNISTVSSIAVKLASNTAQPKTSPINLGGDGADTYTQLIKADGTLLKLSSIGASSAFSIDSISLKKVYTPTDGQVAIWSSQEEDGAESSLHITSEDGTTHTFGENVAINSFNSRGGLLSIHSTNAAGEDYVQFHKDYHGYIDWAIRGDGNDLFIRQSPEGTPVDLVTFLYNSSSPKVGIRTTSPTYTLDVAGTVGVDSYIYHNDDADTYILFTDDKIEIYAGGRQMIKMVQDSTEKITMNSGGMDVDLQIKGENDANLIRTDAANDRVGIKTSAPETELHINGSLTLTEKSSDPSNPAEGNTVLWMSDGTGSGDDGDIMMKITAGGSTKTVTLVDFSAS